MTEISVEYLNHMGDDSGLLPWAAGILEGEGCFSLHTRKSGKRAGSSEVAIHCEMTDKDTIEKLHSVLEVGSICHRENKRSDGRIRKHSWILSIQSQKDVLNTLIKVSPYMGNRRKDKIADMVEFLVNKLC